MQLYEQFESAAMFRRKDDATTEIILFGHIKLILKKSIEYCVKMMQTEEGSQKLLEEIGSHGATG